MLKSESLTFSYNESEEFNFPDIYLEKEESLLVLGNSGVGKTTLIHLLAGFLKPKSGVITLNNINYFNLSANELDLFRGKNIGMVFQKPYFVRNLSIMDNLFLSLYLSKKKQEKEIIIQILEDIGLGTKLNSKPDELSQGEQQRAAIALAVVKKPKLILADEPTSSLDDENCKKIIKLLKKQAALVKSQLVIITHDQRIKREFHKSIKL
tara:strand:- start:487 stop:1113 length:627 start_codon:yes stop_codon:yes gene_type:complete